MSLSAQPVNSGDLYSLEAARLPPQKRTSESAHLKLMTLYEGGVIARAISDANDV